MSHNERRYTQCHQGGFTFSLEFIVSPVRCRVRDILSTCMRGGEDGPQSFEPEALPLDMDCIPAEV